MYAKGKPKIWPTNHVVIWSEDLYTQFEIEKKIYKKKRKGKIKFGKDYQFS